MGCYLNFWTENQCKIPQVVGAIDGTYIFIKAPISSYNCRKPRYLSIRKQLWNAIYNSLVLLQVSLGVFMIQRCLDILQYIRKQQ